MKRLVIAGALASLVAWSGASAQTEQAQEGKGKTVTLTGCLAKGDTADSYTLTNARMGGGATAGTTGEKPAAKETAAMTYHLAPGKTQKMDAHVGHTVQITGTLEAMSDKSAKAGEAAPGASAKMKGTMQHVTVTGLKHVSGTCS